METNMQITKLSVVNRQIADLKLDPKNPRRHSKHQVAQLAASIRAFGFNVPVLTDARLQVIAGHGRTLAAKELGMLEVPTIGLEHLSPEQVRAFQIADNRLTEISTWDDALLGEQLKELSLAQIDFDLEITGFDMGEIDLRIQALDEPIESDPEDELPADSGTVIAKLGDVWQLGHHRIVCGSALEEASFKTLMAGKQAGMAFTDPPFNVRIEGNVSGLGRVKHKDFAMASGEMSVEGFTAFLTTAFRKMAAHTAAGSIHFVCADWRHLEELLAAGRATYTELKNVCVWVKDNGGMGSLYRSQHELVFVFKHGAVSHHNNIQLGQYGRNRTNVWRYAGANSLSRSGKEGNLLALHPTVKPVALVADAILDCSARGDIVLDPFLGSGTTILAAERTGRAARGIELEPRYVDVAIRRWQTKTGESARQAITGKLFDELEAHAEIQVRRG
jgi:DNA modification methylase